MDRTSAATVFCTLFLAACDNTTLLAPLQRDLVSDSVPGPVADTSIAGMGAHRDLVDPRDGKTYRTVYIGDTGFVWMAQNLGFDTLDGIRSWCPDGKSDHCASHGRLYSWQIAVRAADSGILNYCEVNLPDRGVCPAGWHLPSLAEWDSAARLLGGMPRAGRLMKSPEGWLPGFDGRLGGGLGRLFGAVPAGYHFTGNQGYGHYGHTASDSAFYGFGVSALFWTRSFAMPGTCTSAWSIQLDRDNDEVDSLPLPRSTALSVRCVKDRR